MPETFSTFAIPTPCKVVLCAKLEKPGIPRNVHLADTPLSCFWACVGIALVSPHLAAGSRSILYDLSSPLDIQIEYLPPSGRIHTAGHYRILILRPWHFPATPSP